MKLSFIAFVSLGYMVLKAKKGAILLVSLVILMVLLLLGTYFLTFVLTEIKISKSQVYASQVYYLAEAGIHQAIWKLKNEEPYKTDFITQPTCQNWSANFIGGEDLFPNGSYSVSIQNTECASAIIISTATLQVGSKEVKRVIKTTAFKAISSPTQDSAVFSGGTGENIEVYSSNLTIHNGNIYSNNNLLIKFWSTVTATDNASTTEVLEGQALAVNNMEVSWGSTLNSTARCNKHECLGNCLSCPPASIEMPMANFVSYLTEAQTAESGGQCQVLCNGAPCSTKCVFTSSEFEDLLWQVGMNGELTLNNNFTYITGPMELRGGRRLRVNGVLATDGTIDIGTRFCWNKQGQNDCGFNQITVCDFGDPNQPTSCETAGKKGGLLSKGKINFDFYSSFQDIKIGGLVYGEQQITIASIPSSFTVKGGIIGRKVYFISMGGFLDIYLDNSIVIDGLGETDPAYSPVITVEHWEEVY